MHPLTYTYAFIYIYIYIIIICKPHWQFYSTHGTKDIISLHLTLCEQKLRSRYTCMVMNLHYQFMTYMLKNDITET